MTRFIKNKNKIKSACEGRRGAGGSVGWGVSGGGVCHGWPDGYLRSF